MVQVNPVDFSFDHTTRKAVVKHSVVTTFSQQALERWLQSGTNESDEELSRDERQRR